MTGRGFPDGGSPMGTVDRRRSRCDARASIYHSIVPISFASLFRVLVMLLLAFHVFYMYCLARTRADTFGFDLGTTIVAALFGLAMLVPLVWAFTLPELPEIWTTHVRAKRRWRQGRCPSCGYRTEGLIGDRKVCPECGMPLRMPEGYRINAHTIRLFIALNLLAWVIGCAAGEAWILKDERAFEKECAAGLYIPQWLCYGNLGGRFRVWPNSDAILFYEGELVISPSQVSPTPAPSP